MDVHKYNLGDTVFYKKGDLYIGNINYKTLVNKEGSPLVCILLDRIKKNIMTFKSILDIEYPNNKLYYALKASYLRWIVEVVKNLGVGIETISKLELDIATRAGYKPQDIIFNGIGRKSDDLYYAALEGIITNIDSLSELKKLISKKNPEEELEIGLRIHPDFEKDDNFVKKDSKLGITYQEANKCISLALKNRLKISGLSFHIFSNKTDSTDYLLAIKNVLDYISKINSKFSVKIKYLDIGGGIAPRMFFENDDKIKKFIRNITNMLKINSPDITLIFELGRYIVSDSVIILSKISSLKRKGNKLWAILDIGTNYLIPTLGSQFKVIACQKKTKSCLVSFADGICSPAGFIDRTRISKIEEGNYVAVLNAGAYTSVMKEEFVFKSPKHVFIENNSIISIVDEMTTREVLKYHGW